MTKSRVAAVKTGDISDSSQHPPFLFTDRNTAIVTSSHPPLSDHLSGSNKTYILCFLMLDVCCQHSALFSVWC